MKQRKLNGYLRDGWGSLAESMAERTGYTLIDATGSKLGRLASILAKKLLSGETLVVLNAEKAIITGEKRASLERYFLLVRRKQRRSFKTPTVISPHSPENILRTSIVRMLPRKKSLGRTAAERLKVFLNIPERYRGLPTLDIPEAKLHSRVSSSGRQIRYVTLEEIAREIGWRK